MLAVAGVFVIHVCEVFNPWDEWHITSPHRSRAAGEIVLIMAPWIMPLFMLLAGVSAWHALDRRGNVAYIRERIVRVAFPLIIGTLVLVPPQVYLERRLRGQFHGSFWSFFPHFFEGIYPRGNLSWHHLWFLAHLFAYSLLTLPLFRFWQGPRGGRMLAAIGRVCRGPAAMLWLALPLVVERSLLWSLFPERHMLTSDWSNHALLLVAYIYGYVLAATPALGAAIDRQWPVAALAAAASTVALSAGAWTGVIPADVPNPYGEGFVAFWMLYALGAWAWMVATLGMARRWLHRENRVLEYGRRIGYEWYFLHQPVIVALAYVVVRWQTGALVQFVVIFTAAIVLTGAGAEVLSRVLPMVSIARRRPART